MDKHSSSWELSRKLSQRYTFGLDLATDVLAGMHMTLVLYGIRFRLNIIQFQVLILIYGKLRYKSSSFGYCGVPSPVTGSHPSTALKPLLLQPGLLPFLMSLKTPGFA